MQFWGLDTAIDAQRHVEGAMQLLNLRYQHNSPPLLMDRPFDRILVESVLYQAFLLATRQPFASSPTFRVDPDFLRSTMSMLESSKPEGALFDEATLVLGTPPWLNCFILDMIRCCSGSAVAPGADDLRRLRAELQH